MRPSQVWKVEWNVTGTVLSSSGDDGKVRLWKGPSAADRGRANAGFGRLTVSPIARAPWRARRVRFLPPANAADEWACIAVVAAGQSAGPPS